MRLWPLFCDRAPGKGQSRRLRASRADLPRFQGVGAALDAAGKRAILTPQNVDRLQEGRSDMQDISTTQALFVRGLAAVALAAAASSRDASAQPSVEQFYKGKSIDMIIGYPPSGSNDVYARALARHMGKHIPGRPNIVPKNMPGAGSFLAVNNVYAVAPKDGTVLAIGAPTIALDEVLGTPGVRFKTAELGWVGRIDSLINIVFMWHTSKVKTFADAQKYEVHALRHRQGLDRLDLSDRDEQRVRNEVQADHGLQGIGRGAARRRARRSRGPFDVVDRGEGQPSGLVAQEDDFHPGAVLAQPASGIARYPDRRRARPQSRRRSRS